MDLTGLKEKQFWKLLQPLLVLVASGEIRAEFSHKIVKNGDSNASTIILSFNS